MKNFTKSVENGNKNADIFFLCPWGKKWMVNHFSKLNSFRDMNFQKWSITDESFINVYETDNLHDSSVIDHFWKFISRKLLSFEKWFTTHFLPLGHRKKMSAFFSKYIQCSRSISKLKLTKGGNNTILPSINNTNHIHTMVIWQVLIGNNNSGRNFIHSRYIVLGLSIWVKWH